MAIRVLVGMFLVCGFLVSPVAAQQVPVKQVAAMFLLFEQTPDGNRRLLAEPTLTTIVGRWANFWSGGEKFIEGAPSDPWELGTRVDLHIYELKDDYVDVEFKLSVSTAKSADQGPDVFKELHMTGERIRSRFKAKLGEPTVIRSGSSRWLEVTFEEVDSGDAALRGPGTMEERPKTQTIPVAVDPKPRKAEVVVKHIDHGKDGTILTKFINTKFEISRPFQVGGLQQVTSGKDAEKGVSTLTYSGRFEEVAEGQADVELIEKVEESLRGESDDGTPETSRRTTEHRFTYLAQSGKTKVFKISEQQRVEVTFTWDE